MTTASPSFQFDLVGRARESELIDEAVATMLKGRGEVVLLAGDPGVGKSELARAAGYRARDRGAVAFWGRCWEAGGGPAYWPIAQALAPLLQIEGAGTCVQQAGPALFDVLPEARRIVPEMGPVSAIDAGVARFVAARATATFLRLVTDRAPLVLLLDDLHCADLASLELLEALAFDAKSLRLLILGTLRDREVDQANDVRPRLAALARCSRVLPVRPFEADAARALVERHAGSLDDVVVTRVLEATRGNALFLVEIGRLLSTRRQDARDLPLPLGVREAVRQRLDALPAATRQLLRVLAVVGVEASPSIAAQVIGLDGDAALDSVVPAEAAGILQRTAGGNVRFEHGLVREAVYLELDADERRALHLRVADELERVAVGEDRAMEIAHHLLGAGSPARERAFRAAVVAAGAAIARAAYDDAVVVLERLRAEAELELAPAARAELLIALGRARLLAGDLDGGRAVCRSAAALAERRGDAPAMAGAALALGSAWQFGFGNAEVSELGRRALELLGPDGDAGLRARLLARVAAADQPALDPTLPISTAVEAIALARSLGDPRTLLDVLHIGVSALMDYAPPAERRSLNEETLALARRLGDRSAELRSTLRLTFDHLELGDLPNADVAIAGHAAIAMPLSHPRHLLPLAYHRAMRALFAGELAQAEARCRDAEALLGPDSGPTLTPTLHRYGAARARADLPALVALEPALFRVAMASIGPTFRAAMRASVRTWTGELDQVRNALVQALESPIFGDPVWCMIVAEAAAAVGDVRTCEKLRAALEGRRGTFVCWGATGAFIDGPYSRIVALLASALERHDDAVADAAAAVAECRAAVALPLLARALIDASAIQRRRAREGDPETALALETEARSLALSLGLIDLRPLLPVPTEPPRTLSRSHSLEPPVPALVFVREGDLWAIEADGRRFHQRNSRGLEILAQLIARPNEDVHVLDLVTPSAEPNHGGDAGELLDEPARQAYRNRLRELEQDLAEAEANSDLGRSERLLAERDALTAELSRAFGLGGRARRAGSSVERARVAVQRRIRDALRRIVEQDPVLGDHLERAVRTGTTCSYRPALRART